jgi:integrase
MNDILTTTLEKVRISSAGTGPVFLNRQGTPYKSLRTAFERVVLKAAIPDCTFHSLRHTFASRLVMAGVDLPTVKELMGHKDIKMTLRYTFLSSDHKKDVVSKLENYGTKSHQFSQQGTQQESGGQHKSLKSNMLP